MRIGKRRTIPHFRGVEHHHVGHHSFARQSPVANAQYLRRKRGGRTNRILNRNHTAFESVALQFARVGPVVAGMRVGAVLRKSDACLGGSHVPALGHDRFDVVFPDGESGEARATGPVAKSFVLKLQRHLHRSDTAAYRQRFEAFPDEARIRMFEDDHVFGAAAPRHLMRNIASGLFRLARILHHLAQRRRVVGLFRPAARAGVGIAADRQSRDQHCGSVAAGRVVWILIGPDIHAAHGLDGSTGSPLCSRPNSSRPSLWRGTRSQYRPLLRHFFGSIVCLAVAPASFPIAAIFPSRSATSAKKAGLPVPSRTRPPVMRTSYWARAAVAKRRNKKAA